MSIVTTISSMVSDRSIIEFDSLMVNLLTIFLLPLWQPCYFVWKLFNCILIFLSSANLACSLHLKFAFENDVKFCSKQKNLLICSTFVSIVILVVYWSMVFKRYLPTKKVLEWCVKYNKKFGVFCTLLIKFPFVFHDYVACLIWSLNFQILILINWFFSPKKKFMRLFCKCTYFLAYTIISLSTFINPLSNSIAH